VGKVTGARITKTADWEKARRQVARLHYRITCMRDDVLHKLTTRLVNCYGMIGIEDLNIKGLLKIETTTLLCVFSLKPCA
jgi:putative transposase